MISSWAYGNTPTLVKGSISYFLGVRKVSGCFRWNLSCDSLGGARSSTVSHARVCCQPTRRGVAMWGMQLSTGQRARAWVAALERAVVNVMEDSRPRSHSSAARSSMGVCARAQRGGKRKIKRDRSERNISHFSFSLFLPTFSLSLSKNF